MIGGKVLDSVYDLMVGSSDGVQGKGSGDECFGYDSAFLAAVALVRVHRAYGRVLL
ncbi:hypothetical protein BAUCODRAFT_123663 [Baudoinia panamericana UAMH 10762]|uniref:Uncharacterized protein n=1 Tax=Baudoinia panamericana (strain UAMH 10762) TaxID=717646 RepID=M2N8N2_BAUPA|nr:uncharacterized protein BAUCODRAFT_123663 [Baudoinia panamericana UAMH 10762]EMC95195.1 hypothetical protein BAUCODRAFT_123663 [Baudoinia panamericana UAMH 10762]